MRVKLANRGFTLIELVLMISLLGIMVVLYIESAGNLSDIAIDGASRKCQQDIRYAQQLAQTTGIAHGVIFYKNGNYQVYQGAVGNVVSDPATHQPMIENFSKYPGVSINANFQVQFDTTGRPTMGADKRARLIATSGAIRDVYIVDQTGAVIVDLLQKGTGCACDVCSK